MEHEAEEIRKSKNRREEASLNGTTNNTINDRVGSPEASARSGQRDR
jgi:hypothetical protein